MELKKREEVSQIEYAKKDEISTKELKKFTPHKWIVASAVGVATLIYANPKSLLGSIGVVFGCITITESYNYSSVWYTLNSISNSLLYLACIVGAIALIFGVVQYIDYIILSFKKDFNKEEYKKNSQKMKNFIIALIVGAIVAFLIHFILDYYILDMEIPIFFEGGVKHSSFDSPTNGIW
jgi:hypothetical protein